MTDEVKQQKFALAILKTIQPDGSFSINLKSTGDMSDYEIIFQVEEWLTRTKEKMRNKIVEMQ